MQPLFSMLALYNRWANERLYEAAMALPEAEYRSNRGAFFGSLHGTLNYLLVVDRIWLRRFIGDGPTYLRLDEIIHDDRSDLALARRDEDERIISYIEGLSEPEIERMFGYRTIVQPTKISQPLGSALMHFFNHQTHHRGQSHCLLTLLCGQECAPSLDLIVFQRQTGIGLG